MCGLHGDRAFDYTATLRAYVTQYDMAVVRVPGIANLIESPSANLATSIWLATSPLMWNRPPREVPRCVHYQ